MKTSFLKYALAAGLALSMAACGDTSSSSSTSPAAESGAVETAKPRNADAADMGVKATAPDSWYKLSADEGKKLMSAGVDMVTSNSDAMAATAEYAKQKTRVLYGAFAHAPGSPVETNASVLISAEDISIAPGVKTGKDFFFHAQRAIEMSGMPYTVDQELTPYTIDGRSFDMGNMTLSVGGMEVKQRIYLAKRGDYMVSIAQSWVTDEELATTQAIVDGIKLDW